MKQRRGKETNTVEKSFNREPREELNATIARIYSSGLPFNLARTLYYAMAFSYATNNLIVGYTPREYNSSRTSLLQGEKVNIERMLDSSKGT